MKKYLLLLLSLTLLIFSCSDSDDPIPVVEDPSITLKESKADFANEGGVQSISFETNKNWTAKADATWCTLSPTSGTASLKSITVTVAANDAYDDRSCTITISAGGLSKTITVAQGEGLGLLVSDDDKTHKLTNDATTIEVEVQANVEFTVEVSDEWITDVTTRALSSTILKFDIAENSSYDNREGTITIKQKKGDLESIITVYQSQQDAIIVSNKTRDISSESQTLEVELQTNVEFEVIIPEEAQSWVSYTETRALRTETLTLSISENKDYEARSTEVYVKNRATSLQDTLTINQSQVDAIILSEKIHNLSFENQTLEVELKTNVEFEVVIPEEAQNWVMYAETRALRTETLLLVIDDNTSNDARYTEVYVKDKETNLQDTLAITQEKEPNVYWVNEMGTLGEILNQTQKDTITTMVIKGELNKADFGWMKNKMPNLRYIDLTDVKCEDNKIPDLAFGALEPWDANSDITTINLPESITSIGRSAFKSCKGLTGPLNLPESLTTIEEYAFYGCTGFTSDLTLHDGITTIERNAFSLCTGFDGKLTLPKGLTKIEGGVFNNCVGLNGSLDLPAGIKTIELYAFVRCSGFTGSLILPEGLTSIGNNAFQDCTGFTGDLTLPSTLTKIDRLAFSRCSNLSGILKLPASLTSIEDNAFRECVGFTGVEFGDNITTIGGYVFKNCTNIAGIVNFPISLNSLGKEAFLGCTKVDVFSFPHTKPLPYTSKMLPVEAAVEVPSGAVEAYQGASGWNKHTITSENQTVYVVAEMGTLGEMLNETQRDTITTMIIRGEINKADFDVLKTNIPNLTYLDLKDVKCEDDRIPDEAFGAYNYDLSNKNITRIILPQTITTIGESAFQSCTGLTGSLVLPDGLQTIEYAAFEYCIGLTGTLELPVSLTTIASRAFADCTGLTGSLKFPNESTTLGKAAFLRCSGFNGTLTLPEALTSIEATVFYGCTGFTDTLNIPNSVTEIGMVAFQNCGFTSLVFGDKLSTIHQGAFKNCNKISGRVVLPASLSYIGPEAFLECNTIEAFRFLGMNPPVLNNYTLPYGVVVEVPVDAIDTYKNLHVWSALNIVGY